MKFTASCKTIGPAKMMDKVNNSFKVETNDQYFPGGVGGAAAAADPASAARACHRVVGVRAQRWRSAQTPPARSRLRRKTELMAKPVVVVTGVSGNLGSRLLPLLGSYSVIGVDMSPPQTESELQFESMDLGQESSTRSSV